MEAAYDKSKIGKRVASGGDRKVFMYDTDKVIKISSLSFLVGKKLHIKLVHDYTVCKTYLPDLVVDTIDVTPTGKRAHVEIQPYVQGKKLGKEHVGNENIRLQLKQIQTALQQMAKDGYEPIDLVGHEGMIRNCLSNILVDSESNIKIIDTTLLEGKTVRPIGILMDILSPIIKARQNRLLQQLLK